MGKEALETIRTVDESIPKFATRYPFVHHIYAIDALFDRLLINGQPPPVRLRLPS